jgi:hypothetical protein
MTSTTKILEILVLKEERIQAIKEEDNMDRYFTSEHIYHLKRYV